jgi:hypothetical protein
MFNYKELRKTEILCFTFNCVDFFVKSARKYLHNKFHLFLHFFLKKKVKQNFLSEQKRLKLSHNRSLTHFSTHSLILPFDFYKLKRCYINRDAVRKDSE